MRDEEVEVRIKLLSIINKGFGGYFILFILVRNIGAELTSVPIFLCLVCGTPPQHGFMSSV